MDSKAETIRYERLLTFLITSKVQGHAFSVFDYKMFSWRDPLEADIDAWHMRVRPTGYLCHPKYNVVALPRKRFRKFWTGMLYEIRSSHIFAMLLSHATEGALSTVKEFPIVRYSAGKTDGGIVFTNEPDAILFAAYMTNEASPSTKRLML